MSSIVLQLEEYLSNALGDTPTIISWKDERDLAFFLRDRYRFFKARILDKLCVLMVAKGESEVPPATIRKHIDQVQAKWSGPVIYVRKHMTAYNRKRLIEQKIPFIVPNNQMYLLMLGIDLREYFRKPRPDTHKLRPSSQAVLIYAMLQDVEDLSPTTLASKLGYSAMAMSRALDELEAAKIGESTATGRGSDRRLRLNAPKRNVWKKAEPVLRTPVKGRHTIRIVPDGDFLGPKAGLSALAYYTMLAEPENTTVALSRAEWKSFREKGTAEEAMVGDPGTITIEVWSYDPALFAREGWVDRLSLFLSLRGTKNERVQVGLDELMKEIPW